MDPFTERILERARERQKKLLEYNGSEMPLRECNNLKFESMPQISLSQSDYEELQQLKKKNVASDSHIDTTSEANNLALKGTTSEGNLHKIVRQNSKTFVSSNMPGSPQSHLKTLNIQKDDINMEIKLSSTENVRLEVEFKEEEDCNEEKENIQTSSEEIQNADDDNGNDAPVIRENAKKRLQQLGKLYAGGEDANISSPIHRTEPTFLVENNSSKDVSKSVKIDEKTDLDINKPRKGLGGLAALAQTINEWDDNSSANKKESCAKNSANTITKKSWKPPAPRPPISNVCTREDSVTPRKLKPQAPKPPIDICVKTIKTSSETSVNTKAEDQPQQLNLDPALLKTLESQGFTRTTSKSALIYKYGLQNSNENIKAAEISSALKTSHTNFIAEECEENTLQTVQDIKKEKNKILNSPSKGNIRGTAVASKAAIFENSSPIKSGSNSKDPALLSVSERKALFEKNKGVAPVPKAPISMATPLNAEKPQKNQSTNSSPTKATPLEIKTTISKNTPKYPAPRPPIRTNDNVDSSAYRVPAGQPGGIASKLVALFNNKSTISQQQIENDIREQRQKEMDVLLNRFHKHKGMQEQTNEMHSESEDEELDETAAMIPKKPPQIIKVSERPPPPPLPGSSSAQKRRSGSRRCSSTEDSPNVSSVLEDVKRIKVASNKPGRLYPCLSDIETATETEPEQNTASPTPNNSSFEENSYESDTEAAETSFGREILETVCKNQSISSQKRPIYDESTESDVSGILDEMDDYLDEAIAYDVENGPTPPKQGRSNRSPEKCTAQPSSSFQYKNFSPRKASSKDTSPSEFKSPLKTSFDRKSTDLPAYVVDGDNLLPLTHTVSFYRRQQNQGLKTPVRQIVRQPEISEESSEDLQVTKPVKEDNEVQIKIQELLEEMTKQQTIISQTSQALNLCYSTPEFTGSIEQVEAEKVLLLASHRRSAAQREMEKLTVLKTLHPDNIEKGILTISNIVLPLKREYVRALNATGGKGHHVVCLVKCADQVFCTKLVSTVATNDRNPDLELRIPDTMVLNNIYSDFTVQFEVYCLQAQEEILPHEVKYHINNKKPNSKITPKKSKPESRLVRPPKESPGGPQAVRSPTFALMGYVIFSLQAIKRKNWTLNNTPSMSPLEGIVEMRVKCELTVTVEHRGFLTMFEDISGFGAWHRRWCLLKNNILCYWKYPDDEKKKAPIDSIDLKNCITQQIGLVRRDICARLNTILIETTRPAQSQDKDSLIMECRGDTTVIRHLLAADTKEERVEWCTMFNKSLNAAKVNGCTK